MSLFGLAPRSASKLVEQSTPAETLRAPASGSFQWGAGSSMLTPEQIAADRERAGGMIKAGMDYSPVQHWSQGLARVAQALSGRLDMNAAEEAQSQNAAYNQELTQALMTGGGDPLAIMSDPRASEGARAAANKVFEVRNRKPELNTNQQYLLASGIKPGTPEWAAANKRLADNAMDPWTSLVAGGNTVMGRQSAVESALSGGRQSAPQQPPAQQIITERPKGMTDDDLFRQAREAVSQGAPVEQVFQQLRAWGVNP